MSSFFRLLLSELPEQFALQDYSLCTQPLSHFARLKTSGKLYKRKLQRTFWAIHRGVFARRPLKDDHDSSVCTTEGTHDLWGAHLAPTPVKYIIIANSPMALAQFCFQPHRAEISCLVRKGENITQKGWEAYLGFRSLYLPTTRTPLFSSTSSVPCSSCQSPPYLLGFSSCSSFHFVRLWEGSGGVTWLVSLCLVLDQRFPISSTEREADWTEAFQRLYSALTHPQLDNAALHIKPD